MTDQIDRFRELITTIVVKCSVDEQDREVIDLWDIFIMGPKGKILVMKKIDRFSGGIDLYPGVHLGGFTLCVCVCVCVYIYIYIYTHIGQLYWLSDKMIVNCVSAMCESTANVTCCQACHVYVAADADAVAAVYCLHCITCLLYAVVRVVIAVNVLHHYCSGVAQRTTFIL